MPLNTTILNIGNQAMQDAITHVSIHTDAADSNANESSAARQPIVWQAAANGDMVATADVAFTGGAASGPALRVGFWSANIGGTYFGSLELTGDTSFNAAGEYTLTGVTIDGSATDANA